MDERLPGHPLPPELNRRCTGLVQEARRGTKRIKRPYGRPAQVHHAVRALHRTRGRGEHRGCRSAHTHNRHAVRT